MNDDFNTREALSALLNLTSAIHSHVDEHDRYDYQALRRAIETYEQYGGAVLGLDFGETVESDVRIAEELVELVLDVREQERDAGNYERADELRDRLQDLGVTVEDSDDGVSFRFD
jgi:cysteinyl-tRNA synthetase